MRGMQVTSCSKQRAAVLEPLLGLNEPPKLGRASRYSPKASIKAKSNLFQFNTDLKQKKSWDAQTLKKINSATIVLSERFSPAPPQC